MLGTRLPADTFGFAATAKETEKLAALALEYSETWLTVAQMGNALGTSPTALMGTSPSAMRTT
ncbi:MAG: hypothetical protein DI562_01170 [Stenotrophomonas acidaminiphila]|nr:MAG: hypothetical protein DI562_01170 [Stenotrophomonas acidaminiphila]